VAAELVAQRSDHLRAERIGLTRPEARLERQRDHRCRYVEVDRLLHRDIVIKDRIKKASFVIGESVKVVSGPLSDFSGEISEINEDALIMWAHDVDTPEYAARLDALEAAIPGQTIVEGLS